MTLIVNFVYLTTTYKKLNYSNIAQSLEIKISQMPQRRTYVDNAHNDKLGRVGLPYHSVYQSGGGASDNIGAGWMRFMVYHLSPKEIRTLCSTNKELLNWFRLSGQNEPELWKKLLQKKYPWVYSKLDPEKKGKDAFTLYLTYSKLDDEKNIIMQANNYLDKLLKGSSTNYGTPEYETWQTQLDEFINILIDRNKDAPKIGLAKTYWVLAWCEEANIWRHTGKFTKDELINLIYELDAELLDWDEYVYGGVQFEDSDNIPEDYRQNPWSDEFKKHYLKQFDWSKFKIGWNDLLDNGTYLVYIIPIQED